MDDFVTDALKSCGLVDCEHVIDIFKKNEVDEEVFRELSMDDIRQMLPNKVGLQVKIFKAVQNLKQEVAAPSSQLPNVNRNIHSFGACGGGGGGRARADDDNYFALQGKKNEILKSLDETPHLTSNSLSNFMSNNQVSLTLPSSTTSSSSSSHNNQDLKGSDFRSFLQNLMSSAKSSVQQPPPATDLPPHLNPELLTPSSPSSEPAKVPKRKHVSKKLQDHKMKLPVYSYKDDFIKMINQHQVVIVVGETGSGKSTQLTQYLREAGYAKTGRIGCTQPRRIAAKSLAERVAKEMGVELGEEDVGYRIRFETVALSHTKINYMTDGILLQELALEPNVYNYSVIMLDEAHERSLNTDILFGLLKSSLRRRPNLKVIVTSATLDSGKFSEYFNYAPICNIPGRAFPVERIYKGEPEPDYVVTVISTVLEIARYEGPGDILVFLCGGDEIERCCDLLTDKDQTLWCVPCYASLSVEEQQRVFEDPPEGCRKVVVATNIAETSLTIDGIVYVVDSGKVKESNYDPKKGLNTLTLQSISRAQAEQRAGRAGRTRPGKVYRLYSEEAFKKMKKTAVPEIQRGNLESTILLLAANGIEDVRQFDFIDPPSMESIETSLSNLRDLEALDGNCLTAVGRKISRFPLEPRLSKVLLVSTQLNCTEEMLTIVSMLSATSASQKIFHRPKKRQFEADMKKAEFFHPQGDLLTFLEVYKKWKLNFKSSRWCKENFIVEKTLIEVEDIRDQIKSIMDSHNIKAEKNFFTSSYPATPDVIAECICSGYFNQIAKKTPKGHGYVTYSSPNERDQVYIHPASSLFKIKPNYIIYNELINTGNKAYLTNVIAVDPKAISRRAPTFYKKLLTVFPAISIGC